MFPGDDPRPGRRRSCCACCSCRAARSRARPRRSPSWCRASADPREQLTNDETSDRSQRPDARRISRAARSAGRRQPAERAAEPGDAHLPRRHLHRAHGSALQPHRRRAARLSVLGARRSAAQALRRHRLDLRRALQRAGVVRVTDVEGAGRADGDGQGRGEGAGRRERHRDRLRRSTTTPTPRW